jgi:pimeloyl-ACP methyl ester carboxylesterase
MRPKNLILAALLLATFASALLPAPAEGARFRVVARQERRVGPLAVTEETVQVGSDPIARFTLHRMRRSGETPHGALLLMPGGGSNFAFYTADENGHELQSFAAYFAQRGIDVWGYSPRTRGLAPGACAGSAVDCSGMRDWGMQSVVDDGLYIRERIRRVYGGKKPVVGGISLGAMSTLALLNAAPDAWAGAVVWEGMLYSEDPVVLNANRVVCDDLEAQIAGGALWDDTTYPGVRFLYDQATADPDGPTQVPGFPPGFTNRQAYLAALTTPQPAPPSYVPGYTLAVGDLNGFTIASEARLAMLVLQLNHYEALALVRDYTCALAGERTFTDHLPRFRAPVYEIGSGHAFGAWMGDNIELLGSTDITRRYNPTFGHGDLFAHPDHVRLLEQPLLRWLKRVLGF